VRAGATLECRSATELAIADGTCDLVITDPPFGGLLHYSELSDFFYVWLKLVLEDRYPQVFAGEYTPKTLEAVSNRTREPEDPDGYYQRLLTGLDFPGRAGRIFLYWGGSHVNALKLPFGSRTAPVMRPALLIFSGSVWLGRSNEPKSRAAWILSHRKMRNSPSLLRAMPTTCPAASSTYSRRSARDSAV